MSSSGRLSIIPARALDDPRINRSAALPVLCLLGTYADSSGWCWPSAATVGKRLGVSRQAVIRQLRLLEQYGYIERRARMRRDGGSASNWYRILHDGDVERSVSGAVQGSETHGITGGETSGVAGGVVSEVTPIRTSHLTSQVNDQSPQFEAFWNVYPRRIGKGHARKAFSKALTKATFETIMAGVLRHAAACTDTADPRFIKHPSTWLNSEGWSDDIAADLSGSKPTSKSGMTTIDALRELERDLGR